MSYRTDASKIFIVALTTASFFPLLAHADFIIPMDGGAYCYNCDGTPESQFDCSEAVGVDTHEAVPNNYGHMCPTEENPDPIDECKDNYYNQACVCDNNLVCGPDPNSDADKDGIPDNADLCPYGGDADVNADGMLDDCTSSTEDADGNGIPDGLQDSDGDGSPDSVDDSDADGVVDVNDPYLDPSCNSGGYFLSSNTSVTCQIMSSGEVGCQPFRISSANGIDLKFAPNSSSIKSASGQTITRTPKTYTLLPGSSIKIDYSWEVSYYSCYATGALNGLIP